MKSIVAERGQVTIPKTLRDRLGIAPGTILDFHEEQGRLVAVKTASEEPVTQVLGCLTINAATDDIITELRGKA